MDDETWDRITGSSIQSLHGAAIRFKEAVEPFVESINIKPPLGGNVAVDFELRDGDVSLDSGIAYHSVEEEVSDSGVVLGEMTLRFGAIAGSGAHIQVRKRQERKFREIVREVADGLGMDRSTLRVDFGDDTVSEDLRPHIRPVGGYNSWKDTTPEKHAELVKLSVKKFRDRFKSQEERLNDPNIFPNGHESWNV